MEDGNSKVTSSVGGKTDDSGVDHATIGPDMRTDVSLLEKSSQHASKRKKISENIVIV